MMMMVNGPCFRRLLLLLLRTILSLVDGDLTCVRHRLSGWKSHRLNARVRASVAQASLLVDVERVVLDGQVVLEGGLGSQQVLDGVLLQRQFVLQVLDHGVQVLNLLYQSSHTHTRTRTQNAFNAWEILS